MDWSHELLTGKERTVLRRLSVFAGGFTLSAAEAVGAGGAMEEVEVLDVLASLVDKSLVAMVSSWPEFERFFATVKPLDVRIYGRLSAQAEAWIGRFGDIVSRKFEDNVAGFVR